MKIYFDPQLDALFLEFREPTLATVQGRQLSREVIANYTPDGQLTGLRILFATQVLALTDGKLRIEIGQPPTATV